MAGAGHAATISGIGNASSDPLFAGGTVIGFEDQAAGVVSSVTTGGVTFAGSPRDAFFGSGAPIPHELQVLGTYGEANNRRGDRSLGSTVNTDFFDISFDVLVDAFAFNIGAVDFEWTLEAFDLDGNLIESFVYNESDPLRNDGYYIGIAAPGIATARFSLEDFPGTRGGGSDIVFIDEFSYVASDIPAVPLPATALLLLGALGGFAALRRKG